MKIFFFSVFKVLLLNISKTYSDSDCWETNLRVSETNTMHIIQMVQEQHAIYFGYTFFRHLRLILQESKKVHLNGMTFEDSAPTIYTQT